MPAPVSASTGPLPRTSRMREARRAGSWVSSVEVTCREYVFSRAGPCEVGPGRCRVTHRKRQLGGGCLLVAPSLSSLKERAFVVRTGLFDGRKADPTWHTGRSLPFARTTSVVCCARSCCYGHANSTQQERSTPNVCARWRTTRSAKWSVSGRSSDSTRPPTGSIAGPPGTWTSSTNWAGSPGPRTNSRSPSTTRRATSNSPLPVCASPIPYGSNTRSSGRTSPFRKKPCATHRRVGPKTSPRN